PSAERRGRRRAVAGAGEREADLVAERERVEEVLDEASLATLGAISRAGEAEPAALDRARGHAGRLASKSTPGLSILEIDLERVRADLVDLGLVGPRGDPVEQSRHRCAG